MGKYRVTEPVAYLEEGNRGNNSVVFHTKPRDLVEIDDKTAATLGSAVEPRGVRGDVPGDNADATADPDVQAAEHANEGGEAKAKPRGQRG